MKILLDERAYAQKMMESHMLDEKDFYSDLFLLIKYLYSEGYRKAKIFEILKDFNIDTDKYFELINKYIYRASKKKLVQIDYIPVTQKELDTIHNVKNTAKEKLLFTYLVLAKYNNLKSGKENNNDWVNLEEKEIFKLARVACSLTERDKMIYELKEDGYISNSKKITSLNVKVLFVDDSSDPVLKITDMRELGFQYQETMPNNLIRRCVSCGKPYKLKSKKCRAGLCPQCSDNGVKFVNGKRVKKCRVCGNEFFCNPLDKRSYLCPKHKKELTRERARIRKQKSREKC